VAGCKSIGAGLGARKLGKAIDFGGGAGWNILGYNIVEGLAANGSEQWQKNPYLKISETVNVIDR